MGKTDTETAHAMNFVDRSQDETFDQCWPDGVWTCGIYKIVYFPEHADNRHAPAYAAYFKPYGWKNWGNRVQRYVTHYKTFDEAVAACEQHAEKFGPVPHQHNQYAESVGHSYPAWDGEPS